MVVATLGAGATTRVNTFVAELEALSATLTVTVNCPTAVGEPLMAPVVGLSVRPVGSAPALTDHVNGAVPPAALRTWE